ncbi:VanW like protein [Marininema mesophilum]|uniref:VanW like protein n=1 Tax=Marininema mesophilum TaxID=1048340 RepID=A0A1H2WGA9_9BACL|nr:VanW family protein [Marininema mesophilum]SDW79284.1 VanW like protein [Marininema mesophilum]
MEEKNKNEHSSGEKTTDKENTEELSQNDGTKEPTAGHDENRPEEPATEQDENSPESQVAEEKENGLPILKSSQDPIVEEKDVEEEQKENLTPVHHWSKKTKIVGSIICAAIVIMILSLGIIYSWPTNTQAVPSSKKKEEPKQLSITLVYGKKEWTADLRKMGYTGKKDSKVDSKKWAEWIAKVKKEVDEPAVNAHTSRLGAPIKPARMGWKLDVKELEKWSDNIKGKVNGVHLVPLISDSPQVSEEDLKQVGGQRIGHYVTYYNPGNRNRTENVRLSAAALNNRIINPGEVFSYNKTVGERSTARGYKESIIIVKGAYEKGLGGGVCQTSSTLYNSVDSAGLLTVARFSHSKEVTYVPKRRDATVAWYGPDYRFRNNLAKPVMIRASLGGGALTIDIYTVPGTYHQPRGVQSAPTGVHDIRLPN